MSDWETVTPARRASDGWEDVTPGGAAVGNPTLQRQGDRSLRGAPSASDAAIAIGGAGVLGGLLGAGSKEILTGLGTGIGSLPYPAARTVGGFLRGAGQIIGQGGRMAPAAAGAVSGAVGETAGQGADIAFPDSKAIPEITRFVAGGVGPETAKVVPWALRKLGNPAATTADVIDFFRRATGKEVALNAAQKAYLDEQIGAIRGGAKTDEPLQNIGSIMGSEADRLVDAADRQTIAAMQKAAGVRVPGQGRQMADVGGDLQTTINTRYKSALDQRRAEYAANEKARDAIVAQREASGQSIDTTPEYQSLVAGLKAQLKPGLHSPDVASNFEHILTQISTKSAQPKPPFGGMGSDPFAAVEAKKPPVSFQQLDEVRRQLGEAFGGRAPEGYKAIDADTARRYYGQISDLQKKYAGEPQAKLLDDYAERTAGLEKFSSKYGKKSTALDQYREDTFATDPSTLPSAYFKTRASVQALKELTGDATKVNAAALDYANKELTGKSAADVRKWMGSNAEWLAETPVARRIVDNYATKLEGIERSTRNATEFAAQAAKDATLLTGKGLPAQRAVDLITSGNADIWSKVLPAISQSTQAKEQMVKAVRQVVADQASTKAAGDLFQRNIRPFLEGSGVATRAEMDSIAERLANIAAMKIPEEEKLGIWRRMMLQASAGWAASAASRGGNKAYQWSKEMQVPQ